ncbi:MAG: gamma-glutamyl-gamma-aminobutyrate hydrolase family protein [Solirubrobacterales bacterium]|nr:gamma-glutamyl-gamma-aminobutyrate hydrolase family protein [Solirubrobacterales bacterium]
MPAQVAPIRAPHTPDLRPLIAVTTSEVRRSGTVTPTPQGEPPQREMALGLRYLQALEAAGAIPVVIPPLAIERIEPLLSRIDGVCLSGGPDLDPEGYGERRHPLTGPTEADLDAFELALARAADARELPILAVCRGLQVLNVARGGTLHQHLPDLVGDRIAHRQQQRSSDPTHWVSIDPSSQLAAILSRNRAKVNSFHHQAVATIGRGLVASSHASDGTIESLEALDRGFVLGVQWHAECLVNRREQAALFRSFVEAARRFQPGTVPLEQVA